MNIVVLHKNHYIPLSTYLSKLTPFKKRYSTKTEHYRSIYAYRAHLYDDYGLDWFDDDII